MAKAAVTRSIRDDHQKNFLKIFNGLTGKHSRWEIWEDFVTLTAIEISNSTDKVNATERTKMYQTIISKYSAKERDGMAEMLAEVVMGMEQNPDQDFLGSLYMMCELGNDHAGQFFTPYDVCRCMAEITFDPKLHSVTKWPMMKRLCKTAPTSFLRCMVPAARLTRPAISAKLLTLNATSAAKLAMTTAMRSSCAERSMANDRPCKV